MSRSHTAGSAATRVQAPTHAGMLQSDSGASRQQIAAGDVLQVTSHPRMHVGADLVHSCKIGLADPRL